MTYTVAFPCAEKIAWRMRSTGAAANQDAGPYLPDYHAESDTFDHVNQREVQTNAAIATALVWRLADDPDRFGRRLTRAEVEKQIVDTKLDSQMKAFNQWNDWTAGRRGLAK